MPSRSTRSRPAYRSTPRALDLHHVSHEALMRTRLCDLPLRFAGSALETRASVLFEELARRGIRFRPHLWLSTEWFSPDGVPGIAIPFYLAHPRLLSIEKQELGEAEGSTPETFLKLLRHETGHVLDTAYRLHERPEWREVFGAWNAPYQRHYAPKPHSKSFVRYLDNFYAQSHPAEDFAETLAVWLDPSSRWRTRYRGWPALQKLNYVNRLLREVGDQEPLVRSRERVEPISEMKVTLRKYYEDKRRRYHLRRGFTYDRDLKRMFRERRTTEGTEEAAQFLQRVRTDVRKLVADRTGAFQYDIDRLLREMIERSAELELVLPGLPSQARSLANGHARASKRSLRLRNERLMLRVAAYLVRYVREGHHRYVR